MNYKSRRPGTLTALIEDQLKDQSHNRIFSLVVRQPQRIKPFDYLKNRKQIACHILYLAGYSLRDIGEMLDLDFKTVRYHLNKAKVEIDNHDKF